MTNMVLKTVYYVEINVLCAALLSIYFINLKRHAFVRKNFHELPLLIMATIVLCISDMISGVFSGKTYPGVHTLLIISNSVYFLSTASVVLIWLLYVEKRLGRNENKSRFLKFLTFLPFAVLLVALVVNRFNGFIFTINDQNSYARNTGILLHWIVTWFYLLYATFLASAAVIREPQRYKRQMNYSLIAFMIMPLVAAILQMFFYGVSCTQAGITFSIVLLCVSLRNNTMLLDALTGCNNRYALEKFLNLMFSSSRDKEITLFMLDINRFKIINDTYGHLIGDELLKKTAKALKIMCDHLRGKSFLCRYGGDEFVLILRNSPDDIETVKENIHRQIGQIELPGLSEKISVGIGTASGLCTDREEFDRLVLEADQNMYTDKMKSK